MRDVGLIVIGSLLSLAATLAAALVQRGDDDRRAAIDQRRTLEATAAAVTGEMRAIAGWCRVVANVGPPSTSRVTLPLEGLAFRQGRSILALGLPRDLFDDVAYRYTVDLALLNHQGDSLMAQAYVELSGLFDRVADPLDNFIAGRPWEAGGVRIHKSAGT